MKKSWLQHMEENHRELMNWVMEHPLAGKKSWPEWENQKHHFLYFHPCIIDGEYCLHYQREPEERCSYCPLGKIKENGDVECCHGYMLAFEQSLRGHDRERIIEYAKKLRELPWENPHDVRTRWHTLRLIRDYREKEYHPAYRPEGIPERVAVQSHFIH